MRRESLRIARFVFLLQIFHFFLQLSGALLQTFSKVIPLAGSVDHLSGMVIGIVVGFLFLSGILTGLQHFTAGRVQTDIAESPLGTFMTDNFGVTIRAVKLVPGDWDEKAKGLQSGLEDGAGELKEKVEKLKQEDKSGDPEKFPPQ